MNIVVDSREPEKIIKIIRAETQFKVTIKRLPVFDYIINDEIGVERKTWPDLVRSVIDRALYKQMRRMIVSKLKPYILIEGTTPDQAYRILSYLPIRQDAKTVAKSAIISIALSFNIPIIYSEGHWDTPHILRKMAEKHEVYRDKTPIMQRRLSSTEKVLCLIDGIGTATARRISKEMGKNFNYYNREKLLKVNGVGKKTADRIIAFLGEFIVFR